MKKSLLGTLLILAALLCLCTGSAAAECVEHTINCTDPTTCTYCGATVADSSAVSIIHDFYAFTLDAQYCQVRCHNCDWTAEVQEHRTYCDMGTTCSSCEAEGVIIEEDNVYHYHEYVDLGTQHQQVCPRCDYKGEPEDHETVCTNSPDFCWICGLYGVTITAENIIHNGQYVSVGAQHQYQCLYCDYKEDELSDHFAYCNAPTTCALCYATGLTIPNDHIYHRTYYTNLGTQHQALCANCDYKEEAEEHRVYCNTPTVCSICKVTGLTVSADDLYHYGSYVDLGTQHQGQCNYCDYKTEAVDHYVYCTDQSSCYACGATGFEITWENRYCRGPITFLSYTETDDTFSCAACGETYTEPHNFDEDGKCACGYAKPTVVPGDTSGDGVTDMRDALRLLRSIAGWDVEINDKAADVNGDGSVDMRDALRLLRYIAGWDVTLN
ncbi:MAG: hypothetical protein IJ438_08775 [Clostridia bacterium]|nr:hypothetical protein [Clostridia bacterium]